MGDVLTGDPAGVERPHRQLGSRLTDGLGGDDAHRLTDVDGVSLGEGAAVAGRAHAAAGLAVEHRADLDLAVGVRGRGVEGFAGLRVQAFDQHRAQQADLGVGDLRAGVEQHVGGARHVHRVGQGAPVQRL